MTPAAELLRLIQSNWITQAIAVAAELRLPDLLASGVNRLEDLANATECHTPSLYRLLRALTSLGVCYESDRSFMLTPMGSMLQSDKPASLRTVALWAGSYQWAAWGNILHSVKTGESAGSFSDDTNSFAHMEQNPQKAAIFHSAMTEGTRLVAQAVVSAYDFSCFNRLVDVGGGYGEMLVAILKAYHNINGVLFDLPSALAGARGYLERAGVADRCELVTGDFFAAIPSGADGYLLKSVIHDWPDQRAEAILRCCRAAIPRKGKLLLVEQIMPEQMASSAFHQDVARRDLTMLVMLGGRERTASEFGDLLAATDFSLTEITPVAINFSVIEAVPRESA